MYLYVSIISWSTFSNVRVIPSGYDVVPIVVTASILLAKSVSFSLSVSVSALKPEAWL